KLQSGTVVPDGPPHLDLRGVSRALAWSGDAAQPWSVGLARDGVVLSRAHEAQTGRRGPGPRVLGAGTLIAIGFVSLSSNHRLQQLQGCEARARSGERVQLARLHSLMVRTERQLEI